MTQATLKRKVGLPRAPHARDVMQVSWPPSKPEPLPAGTPGRATAADVGVTSTGTKLSLLVIGDSGGVKTPGPQNAVAHAIAQDATGSLSAAALIYHVGDIVYFNGDPAEYAPQFYEPYAHVQLPIVGVPGNHDGDSSDGVAGSGIGSFMANFCTTAPQIPPGDLQMEYGRHTQTQPYCDWTLRLDAATIIGVWSNVITGGHLYDSQTAWLQAELAAAPLDRPVIVTVHHPPYSIDAHHGGSKLIGDALDAACDAAGRFPAMVLSGHVHNYQRFTRHWNETQTTYVVIGNSGYHNLHKLAADATPGKDMGNGITFEAGDDAGYGFLGLQIDGATITGSYAAVTPGTIADGSDARVQWGKDTFSNAGS